jgi:hypothetical protein
MNSRRQFITQISLGGTALLAGNAFAQGAMVAETDAQAKGLGYAANTATVDAKKYPKHAVAQNCSNCALYQGKAGEKAGGCPLFAGKQVAAAGWCNAYAPKA